MSPLVAEIFLIAAMLILGIAVGGFYFGALGSYSKTADVSINDVICNGSNSTTTFCVLSLDNLGTAFAELKPSSYLLIFDGQSSPSAYSRDCVGQGGNAVTPGSSLLVDCSFHIPAGNPGTRFVGWVALVTGQDLPFAGSF